jgi:hypothetical protein
LPVPGVQRDDPKNLSDSELPQVNLRGGGLGATPDESSVDFRVVYGPDQRKANVSYEDGADGFLTEVAALLKFDQAQPFQFHVDIYNYQKKGLGDKPFRQSFNIVDTNFIEVYRQSIESRLYNQDNDWIVAVTPGRPESELVPKSYSVASPPTMAATPLNPTLKAAHTKSSSPAHPLYNQANTHPPSLATGRTHPLYGYQGMVNCVDADDTTILNEVIRMAGKNISMLMEILVFLPPMPDGREAIPSGSKPYKLGLHCEEVWKNQILPHLREQGSPRTIFAWNLDQNPSQECPSEITPPDAMTNVISLKIDARTAYWKVASNLSEDHGINQLQPGFRGAMEFLMPPDISFWDVTVDGISLGSPGKEITKELFDRVWRTRTNHNRLWNVLYKGLEQEDIVRVIGSSRIICAGNQDWDSIRSAISEVVKQLCRDARYKAPTSVKIWRSTTYCEEDTNWEDSLTLTLSKMGEASVEEDFRIFMKAASTPIPIPLCIPFRPSWERIVIHDISKITLDTADRGESVTWNLPLGYAPTLARFRAVLRNVVPFLLQSDDFFVREIGADDNRNFRITKHTTENEWRVNVYNWLHNGNIGVQKLSSCLSYGKRYCLSAFPIQYTKIHFRYFEHAIWSEAIHNIARAAVYHGFKNSFTASTFSNSRSRARAAFPTQGDNRQYRSYSWENTGPQQREVHISSRWKTTHSGVEKLARTRKYRRCATEKFLHERSVCK